MTAGLTTFATADAATSTQAPGTVFVADDVANQVVALPGGGGSPTPVAGDVSQPQQLALDGAGDLFIADSGHNRVLKVPADGSTPVVVATGLSDPTGIAVNSAGNLFVANRGTAQVLEFTAGGGAPTPVGTGLVDPTGVATNDLGDVFIADFGNNDVIEIPGEGGPQHPVGVGLSKPYAVAVETGDFIVVADYGNNRAVEIEPEDNDTFDLNVPLSHPKGVFVDAAGDIFISDSGHHQIVELPLGGGQRVVRTGLAAPTGVAAIAPNFPAGSPPRNASKGTAYSFLYRAFDPTGATPAYQLASGSFPPGLSLDGSTGQLSGTPTTPGSYTSVVENTTNHTRTSATTITVSGPGTLFVAQRSTHGPNRVLERVTRSSKPVRVGQDAFVPEGLALSTGGGLFIADSAHNRVISIPATGTPQLTIG